MTPLTRQDRLDGTALLVLRAGLVWFIFLWAAHKVITPDQYRDLVRYYEGADIGLWQVYGIAGVQITVCALALIGVFRPFSYGALLVMHFFTLTRRWEGFFDPFALNDRGFPINRNQVVDLAVFGAMIALLLLIHRDHFSLGGWLSRRRGRRWWV
ncbi:hypothetical protein [Pikeienuella sp. HZG-20]|uniref:hypothetical protein n=1 Tax=Paludibacillus litoralis TaxID=3133267 RepID=UPI0030EB9AB2